MSIEIKKNTYLFVLIILSVIMGFPNTSSVPPYDASTYLNNGLEFNIQGPAPLYTIWYKGLSILGFTGTNLYHLSSILLLILSTIALFLLFQHLGYSINWSFLIALLFCICSYYKFLRVSHLALLISALGYFFSFNHKTAKYDILILTSILLALVRAEYLPIAFIFWLLSNNRIRSSIILAGGIGLFLFTNVMDSGRLDLAISQHYAYHYSFWYSVIGNVWVDYDLIPFDLILYLRFCFENTIIISPLLFWIYKQQLPLNNRIFIIPSILCSILIFPRPRYWIPIIPFLFTDRKIQLGFRALLKSRTLTGRNKETPRVKIA